MSDGQASQAVPSVTDDDGLVDEPEEIILHLKPLRSTRSWSVRMRQILKYCLRVSEDEEREHGFCETATKRVTQALSQLTRRSSMLAAEQRVFLPLISLCKINNFAKQTFNPVSALNAVALCLMRL